MRTIEVATTYNKAYYDLVAKQMVESFVRHWPKDCTLHVYWQEQEPEIIEDNIVYHELYKVQPQLKEFVDKWKDDPVKHGWREDRGKFVWKNNGVKFSHKVFAQTHRIKNSTADVILYSDADTLYTAKPNLNYLSEICPPDSLCTFFDRKKLRDETGFYMHNPKHPRAKDWAQKNDWFGKDKVMTNAAYGIHEDLVTQGFDPESEDYYNEINFKMREYFPNKFEQEKRPTQTVASAGRKQEGRRVVKLTRSQVAIAKKLGVPLEEYAKFVK